MSDFTDNLQPQYDGGAILVAERGKSHIDVAELSRHLLSRDDFLVRQARIVKVLENEPLFSKKNQLNLSRPDRFHLGLARAKALRRLTKKHDWDFEDYRMAEYLTDEMSPYHLQSSMFATTVREQGSDEQQRYWMPLIDEYRIIGCYGQTELGHGSNVKGLECKATYDARTREFIIHSPTLTAAKWWNGSLGRTATHAIVVAQLVLPSGDHGPRPFIVQIRDMKTHQPLEGVVVGDIGPKYGYACKLQDETYIPKTKYISYFQPWTTDTCFSIICEFRTLRFSLATAELTPLLEGSLNMVTRPWFMAP
jgi:acyl-CoA oxidase